MFRCLFLLLNLFDVFCIYLPYQNSMLEKTFFCPSFDCENESPHSGYHKQYIIVYL